LKLEILDVKDAIATSFLPR